MIEEPKKPKHIPVMLSEVIKFAGFTEEYKKDYNEDSLIIDVTFGFGGYTKALLTASKSKLIAFDRDTSVQSNANTFRQEWDGRFSFINDKFSNIDNHVSLNSCDLIVADFGISSMQVDEAERGFSFMQSAKLDMRMNQSDKITAFDVVNNLSEAELADIIFEYGEERLAKKIAYNIVTNRKLAPIQTTKELADIAFKCYGKMAYSLGIHPATRTFQAIRIYINKELEEIKFLVEKALLLLKPGGRFVCVSFHSLEDKIIKDFVKLHFKKTKNNKYQQFSLTENDSFANNIIDLSNGAVAVSKEEAKQNPRSRSAKLRCFEKI